ncbi:BZ3500_MvSof-1268-A1-R1_Chr9g10663 [Microbotryum saponariae]|uniref:BZ3500_MvSof-1268-A1-R1_Chr9g10663 protein n=1 Tax=Microbotryum saponariae TaxID=289078 RepID=A0A2X0L4T6_9BASI|nr:BZ3501_MvSof-1269-A2-R1_Chr9g10411 [Microbotryum saponariae]SDA00479.1 BZ3500_MvSof-1268-A1-R1_Chr9g10663 [Microbotryum saponariae]
MSERKQTRSQRAAAQAKSDVQSVGKLGADAAKSGAYLYPIYGLIYFLRNPKLFNSVRVALYRGVMWSICITVGMFIVTYLPQVAVLSVVSGPLESYAITNVVLKSFLLAGATDKLFDAVLVNKGLSSLVERGREVNSTRGGGAILGKSLLKPISSKFSTEGLVRYVLTLPLNLVPAVGTIFFLFFNGWSSGPAALNRYFQLKGFDKQEKKAFVDQHHPGLTSLGAAQLALGLVPIAGTIFAFSNAVGAALYAADLEKKSSEGGEAGGKDTQQVDLGNHDEL